MLYFAYGSNMNIKQMKDRCPGSHFLKAVFLNNAGFRYDGRSKTWNNKAVANINSIDGENVWGGLFEINSNDLAVLDLREGFPKHYGKKIVRVSDIEGNVCEAWVYFRIGEEKGEPSSEYREIVLKGAKDCNLPEDYVKKYLNK